MALTFERWLAAAVAGCLIAVVLVSSGSDVLGERQLRAPGRREMLADRVWPSADALRLATERIHIRVLRDSVLGVLAKQPRTDSVRLLVSELVPKQAQVARALNARLLNALPRPLATGVDMVIPADSVTRRGWTRSPYNFQVLPASASGRCVAISGALATRDIGARDWIGPCGFYAAYGPPGPNIDRWLRSGGWIYGARWRGSATLVIDEGWSDWYFASIPWREVAGFRVRRWMSTQGYSCLTGNKEVCRSLVLDPRGGDGRSEWYRFLTFRDAMRLDGTSVWSRPGSLRYAGLLGPFMPDLLMEMSKSLGPDKFAKFWKSDLPPAEAFRAASGEEIEDWTLTWMRTVYGKFGRGPGVSMWSAALGVLLGALALGGASLTWRRRQVA